MHCGKDGARASIEALRKGIRRSNRLRDGVEAAGANRVPSVFLYSRPVIVPLNCPRCGASVSRVVGKIVYVAQIEGAAVVRTKSMRAGLLRVGLVAIGIAFGALAVRGSQGYTVYGGGTISCGKWLSERKGP